MHIVAQSRKWSGCGRHSISALGPTWSKSREKCVSMIKMSSSPEAFYVSHLCKIKTMWIRDPNYSNSPYHARLQHNLNSAGIQPTQLQGWTSDYSLFVPFVLLHSAGCHQSAKVERYHKGRCPKGRRKLASLIRHTLQRIPNDLALIQNHHHHGQKMPTRLR